MKRINFLDGFRGIAILLVVLYHAYVRWSSVVPYGHEFSNQPVLNTGWIGVQLFFLISGFVILMTLEKSKNFLQFISKRWLRLFPAMLVATVLIFLTAPLLPERPEGMPKLSAVIPGLIFIEPRWIHLITRATTGVLDGAFWSLFVEVKYYFIFGLLYFYFGKKRAITGLFICYLAWFVIALIIKFIGTAPPVEFLSKITQELSFKHFGWFTSGSLAYLYYSTKDRNYLLYALITGLLSIFSLTLSSSIAILPAGIIVLIFLSAVHFDFIKKIIANRVFVFCGFISYPLYLIHQNAMVALILKINKQFTGIPDPLLPVIPILFLMLIAYLIAKLAEPAIKKILNNRIVLPLIGYWQKRQ